MAGSAALLDAPTELLARCPTTSTTSTTDRPRLGAIMRHLGFSILMANVVPSVLFYLCLMAGNVWTALIAALVWCYGSMAWRLSTKRRVSGLLLLTHGRPDREDRVRARQREHVRLFPAAGDHRRYRCRDVPASLATARPVVARLAGDFFPMSADVASRPRIQRLFWELTLVWAVICLAKAVATVWLLESFPLVTFVAMKEVMILSMLVMGMTVSITSALRVARSEGLLHKAAVA